MQSERLKHGMLLHSANSMIVSTKNMGGISCQVAIYKNKDPIGQRMHVSGCVC